MHFGPPFGERSFGARRWFDPLLTIMNLDDYCAVGALLIINSRGTSNTGGDSNPIGQVLVSRRGSVINVMVKGAVPPAPHFRVVLSGDVD